MSYALSGPVKVCPECPRSTEMHKDKYRQYHKDSRNRPEPGNLVL